MVEKILKNIFYTYYPRGIDNNQNKEAYLNSKEYKKLSETITCFNNYKDSIFYKNILIKINNLGFQNNISDSTLISWEDRCITLEIDFLNKNILSKICINKSLLIPFYTIYLLENEIETNPYRWKTIPKRNRVVENSSFKEIINSLSSIIEKEIGFFKMQDSLLEIVIRDINFNDIEFGSFNFFNAFFLNENKFK